jgi:hypothetical protein
MSTFDSDVRITRNVFAKLREFGFSTDDCRKAVVEQYQTLLTSGRLSPTHDEEHDRFVSEFCTPLPQPVGAKLHILSCVHFAVDSAFKHHEWIEVRLIEDSDAIGAVYAA